MELPQKTQKIIAVTCAIVLAALGGILIGRELPSQKENSGSQQSSVSEKQSPTPETTKTEENSVADDAKVAVSTLATPVAYSYTAAVGDSYTQFARDAVAQYATTAKAQLTSAQALNAEIALANAAGAPLLEVGQAVSIDKAQVANVLGMTEAPISPPVASSAANEDAPDQDENNNDAETSQPDVAASRNATASSAKDSTQAKSYDFTAQTGDGYSLLARSAVTSYIESTKQVMTPAQRVAAEAFIVQAAGSPLLEIGQVVAILDDQVTAATTQAMKLNQSELAAWDYYVSYVTLS